MKQLLSLTAWNWRMFQKPYCLLLALCATAELALVCMSAVQRQNAPFDYAALFLGSLAWLVFPLAYLAAIAVSLYPMLLAQGRSKAAYTQLTLPLPRAALLLGQMLATALALLGLIAWQVLLCAAFYWPATALQSWAGRGYVTGLPAAQGMFYRGTLRNLPLRMLLPTTLQGAVALAAAVIAPAVLATGAFCQKGWRRVAAVCLGLAGAWCCCELLMMTMMALYRMVGGGAHGNLAAGVPAALAAIVAASWAWSLYSVSRARQL